MATALITGASKGLGEEFAWQLATAKHDVVLVARDRDALSEMADTIRGAAGVQVEVLAADLSTPEGLEAVAERVGDRDRPISLLVNNAGYGLGEELLDTTWEAEKAAMDVLVTATLRLSQVAAKSMTARGHGAILNISSIASHLANTTYAAHKRWVRDFTEALASQLHGTGVTATVVLPGLVRTHFHDAPSLAHMRDEYPGVAWLAPEQVVESALAAVRRRAVVVTPSAKYAVAGTLMRATPSAVTRRMRSMRSR
ncbi:SDR family oxidoreductase [Demequina sp. NBRC 110057]|uniref:SDR family NAD(P)-dependent oxidoreductase n=1 Tax=Demequina sp. NBRC 110057 TaxID=1570346 RepID=UPI000A059E79|nr:SDR family NAD(P)-dependent oxidoreductase [Demequina sp. NBRC 110057]